MRNQIEDFIDCFNSGWTQGKIEDLIPCLHEEVVFIAPDLETEITGKVACLQSIKDYVNNAKTEVFEVTNTEIHTWHQTAVISITYYIEYVMSNKTYKENGKEFWTLSRQNDSWQMVWRAMVENKNIE